MINLKIKFTQNPAVFFLIAVGITIIGSIFVLVMVLSKDEPKKEANTNQNTQQEQKTTMEKKNIKMETNFGVLNIEMLQSAAPKTTENFIRLSEKGYYDGLNFHRIAKGQNFMIIQGGDPKGNGTGGASVFGGDFEDEVYKKGTKEFTDASLYADYNGRYAVYKKGMIAMANRGPNTNGSQFFIMLDDTFLPPAYTIFGKISEADFAVLDKIAQEVEPVGGMSDGKPNKELKIIKNEVISAE